MLKVKQTIWVNVTSFFRWKGNMVGVIRTEMEFIKYILKRHDLKIKFCYYNEAKNEFFELKVSEILNKLETLVNKSANDISLLSKVYRRFFNPGIKANFLKHDIYFSLGLDTHRIPILKRVYELKQEIGFKVVLFCYDLIPAILPQLSTLVPMTRYYIDLAWCADKISCISDSARNDLANFLKRVGAPIPHLKTILLGDNVQSAPTNNTQISMELNRLTEKPYILFVSTIEARKNIEVLYRAYSKYLSTNNKNNELPQLLLVGKSGWGVKDLLLKIKNDPQVSKNIKILNNINDSDLDFLYRNCLFTIYPSYYEGWGLPVRESLAYGKFCLCSNTSSLPEAGLDFVEYINPYDTLKWAERIHFYSQRPQELQAKEEYIKSKYKPSTWEQAMKDVVDFIIKNF